MMTILDACASQPPHPPFGHLLPVGEKGKIGAASPQVSSPQRGEGGGSRMRGRHGTMPATIASTNLNHHSSPTTGGKL
jgi:hypothetical protein